jgi:hypothetical protein
MGSELRPPYPRGDLGERFSLMRQEFRDVRMDAMQELRDHVKIRINIMEHAEDAKPNRLATAEKELAGLEQEIAEHRAYRGEMRGGSPGVE